MSKTSLQGYRNYTYIVHFCTGKFDISKVDPADSTFSDVNPANSSFLNFDPANLSF